LDVGIYESITVPFLAPFITRLTAEHPMMRIRSREIEPEDALDAVAHGDLDLAFTLTYPHDPVPHRHDLARTPIADERFVAVIPITETAPASLDLATLAGRPFVAPSPTTGCGRAVVLACRDAGFEPEIAHQVDSYRTALDLVGAGCGVAIVPECSVPTRLDVRSVRLTVPVTRTIDVSNRVSSAQRPIIRAALDCLIQIGAQTQHSLAS
jgi:DNA-binding transcriptional LysR family regulator